MYNKKYALEYCSIEANGREAEASAGGGWAYLDHRLAQQRRTEKGPEGDEEVAAGDASQVKQLQCACACVWPGKPH